MKSAGPQNHQFCPDYGAVLGFFNHPKTIRMDIFATVWISGLGAEDILVPQNGYEVRPPAAYFNNMLVVHSRHQPTRTGITTAQLTVLSRTIG